MSLWPLVPLGEVARIDRRTVAPDDILAGTHYVGLENIERGGQLSNVGLTRAGQLQSAKHMFNPAHVLYGKLRPNLAKIARPDFSGVCSTDILPVTPGRRLDRSYLAHFLISPATVSLATSRASGANLPRLSPAQLAGFLLPLPPIEEQRRIADILDRADAILAQRRQSTGVLDNLSASLFHYTLEQRTRDWVETSLQNVVAEGDSINYGVVQPGGETPTGVPLIRAGDLQQGSVRIEGLKRIAPGIEASYRRSRIVGNEVLVGCVGSIGEIALVDERLIGANVARAVARVPVASAPLRRFVADQLRSTTVQQYFIRELRTVAQPTLNIKQLAETRVVVPPPAVIEAYDVQRTRIDEVRKQTERQAVSAAALVAALQHRAFRGEL